MMDDKEIEELVQSINDGKDVTNEMSLEKDKAN